MKVLFLTRPTLTSVLAGDSVQVLQTKKALEELGVRVDLRLDLAKVQSLEPLWDLIHIFDTIPIHEIYPLYKWAKSTGLPLALSPIYWDAAGWVGEIEAGPGEKKRREWWNQTQNQRKEIIETADLLLPNAHGEAAKIHSDFGFQGLKYRVIPNAVEPIYALGSAETFRHRYKVSGPFVFCSARIDARKNQLALIEALKGTGCQLIFAGAAGDAAYFRAFNQALGPKIRYLGLLKPRDLAHAYAAAKVHALVSWYDTPGLSSLEAALAGCSVVSTDRGTAREYLGQDAFYCNPADPESIREAVTWALARPVSPALSQRVGQEYTWKRAGERTLAAYQELLGKN